MVLGGRTQRAAACPRLRQILRRRKSASAPPSTGRFWRGSSSTRTSITFPSRSNGRRSRKPSARGSPACLSGRIAVETPPRFEPRSPESDFLFAGFGECFDSFFAFGLFALARASGYFAPRLVAIFEPVIQEEARHILFFVNWVRYRRSQLRWWKRPGFRLRCAWIICNQVAARIRTARTMGHEPGASGENFTLSAHQELGAPVTLHRLLQLSLGENDRRMAGYDSRLLRPRLVPSLARFLYRVLPASI